MIELSKIQKKALIGKAENDIRRLARQIEIKRALIESLGGKTSAPKDTDEKKRVTKT